MAKAMTQERQMSAFKEAIESVIERFADEFDLTYCAMIGVLEETKFWLLLESVDLVPDEDEEEELEEDDDEDAEDDSWKN